MTKLPHTRVWSLLNDITNCPELRAFKFVAEKQSSVWEHVLSTGEDVRISSNKAMEYGEKRLARFTWLSYALFVIGWASTSSDRWSIRGKTRGAKNCFRVPTAKNKLALMN
jgi:hypothetical protein